MSVRAGLALLPIATTLNAPKVTRRVEGKTMSPKFLGQVIHDRHFGGYEIHLGQTFYDGDARAFAEITRQGTNGAVCDGAVSRDDLVIGTYVHGLFDEDAFRHVFIRAARACEPAFVSSECEGRFNQLASEVRRSLGMGQMKWWLSMRCSATPEKH